MRSVARQSRGGSHLENQVEGCEAICKRRAICSCCVGRADQGCRHEGKELRNDPSEVPDYTTDTAGEPVVSENFVNYRMTS